MQTVRYWDVSELGSIAPLVEDERRGIYVLGFLNGERYVGQATNVVSRFASHRHGSTHHAGWDDIVTFGFLPIPSGDLNAQERALITQQRKEGVKLRNRAFNIGHEQPCALDEFLTYEAQLHWATGDAQYPVEPYAQAAAREPGGEPILFRSKRGKEVISDGRTVGEAVVDELALLVRDLIPEAPALEGRYWTLSDYPSTSGGRFATLNVGPLEIAYFPRRRYSVESGFSGDECGWPAFVLNAPDGLFIPDNELFQVDDMRVGNAILETDRGPIVFWRGAARYRIVSGSVDQAISPVGIGVIDLLEFEELAAVRGLVIDVMRRASGSLNLRSHSRELARRVYERICAQSETD